MTDRKLVDRRGAGNAIRRNKDRWTFYDAVFSMKEFDPPLRWRCEDPEQLRRSLLMLVARSGAPFGLWTRMHNGEILVVKLPCEDP